MDLKIVLIVLIGLAIAGVGVLALTNNVFLVVAVVSILIALYFYMEWRALASSPMPPYTMLRKRINQAISQCNSRTLGYLILRGDSDFQRITLGRMVGIIEWNLETNTIEKEDKKPIAKEDKSKLFPKGWGKMLIIGYKTKYGGIWSWPIISSLAPIELFACARHQLWDDPGFGDLRVKGVSIEPVYMFWMINSVDLDKDYIASAIGAEVHRITLERYFDKLPDLIDDAVKSNGLQLQIKELMQDKKKNPGIL